MRPNLLIRVIGLLFALSWLPLVGCSEEPAPIAPVPPAPIAVCDTAQNPVVDLTAERSGERITIRCTVCTEDPLKGLSITIRQNCEDQPPYIATFPAQIENANTPEYHFIEVFEWNETDLGPPVFSTSACASHRDLQTGENVVFACVCRDFDLR